jgi:soluble lytic murein transglycosylase-like protein
MVLLTFLSGSLKGTQSRFEQPVVRIGRAADCDLRLDEQDLAVSNHHAEIVRDADGYVIIDIASTNGTWLGRERVAKHRLAPGDVIVFGQGGTAVRVDSIEALPAPDGAARETRPPRHTVPMARTPPPMARTPAPGTGPEIAERVKRNADTTTARVADIAAARVAEERARAGGGSSGQTMLIMADAVAETHRATKAQSGRRWSKVVAAVAGAGVLVAAGLGVVIWLQRQEIKRLVAQKQSIDRDIEAVQKAMEGESDAARLAVLEQRLDELTGNARSTIGELARQDREKARELEDSGDELDRAIRRILVKFDAPTYAVPPVFKQALQEQVDVLARSSNLKFIYRRRTRYWPMIQREFSALGLPEEMAYIAWAETQFDPEQVSPAGAKGMWQMGAPTARELGLRVDDEVDERIDVAKQTKAAARKLANLLSLFGTDSFMLAMASYNRGEAGVRRVLLEVAQEKDGFRKEKRDFWHLYRLKRLPTETLDYVPRVLAAAVVCSNPARYGLEPERPARAP